MKKTKPLLGGYPILAEARVDATATRKITGILLDPDSYDPSYAMACLFDPEHALRFERASDVVDVIICFKCGDLIIQSARTLGERHTMQPFGRVSRELYQVVQEVLPEPRVAGH